MMRRLSVRLVFSFLVLTLLTALAVGLPAIWLMNRELERQAGAQLEGGRSAVLSLLDKQSLELENFAILTAQRPTLNSLLEENDLTGLENYLATLQDGANLDLINICLPEDTLAGTRTDIPACGNAGDRVYSYAASPGGSQIWMLGRAQLDRGGEQVVVGIQLDQGYVEEVSLQTGMALALIDRSIGDPQVVSSISPPDQRLNSQLTDCLAESREQTETWVVCSLWGSSYFASITPLEGGEWGDLLVALDTTSIQQAQKGLVVSMAAAILIVAAVGASLGLLLSRLVSSPLEALSETAAAFSQGDLETSFSSGSKVQEITRVAQALENARGKLIHSLRSLAAEKEWSENLLASIVEAIITLDEEGRIQFFSHGAERLTGLLASEAAGREISEVIQLSQDDSSLADTLFRDPVGYQRIDATLPDGRRITCAITSAPLNRAGEFEEGERALVIRDISEEEAVHRLLGHFIADVAHELRTPLTALEASIEMLRDQDAELTSSERAELHTSLHLGILGLHTLVDNLLESANIEARHFRISPRAADLKPIIARAVQTMQPLLSKYEQRLTLEFPMELPRVVADPRRTEQVLVNLISNANRYGPPGEEIILQLSVLEEYVRIAVKDRGPGIPPEKRDNLFRRFEFPHDENSSSQAGAGLGLSVVKEIIRAHGGEVDVEDHPGGGSVFWFTLPVDRERP